MWDFMYLDLNRPPVHPDGRFDGGCISYVTHDGEQPKPYATLIEAMADDWEPVGGITPHPAVSPLGRPTVMWLMTLRRPVSEGEPVASHDDLSWKKP